MNPNDSIPTPISRRTTLKTLGVIGSAGILGGLVSGQEATIKLEGSKDFGWRGVAPASIEGVTAPTLELQAGKTYTLIWENVDGDAHNFAIRSDSGSVLQSSSFTTGQGTTQTVTIAATPDMTQYLCQAHPEKMNGQIVVTEATPTPTPTPEPTPEPTSEPTPEPTPEPTEAPTDTPADTTTDAPADTTTDAPAETTTEAPTETPAETTAEPGTETPADPTPGEGTHEHHHHHHHHDDEDDDEDEKEECGDAEDREERREEEAEEREEEREEREEEREEQEEDDDDDEDDD